MRILYIHGLDSSPNPDRIESLEMAGHEVFALHLDYRNQADSYAILRRYAQEHDIEYLIGSSLGGALAFWLGEELGVPCLLFNPAVAWSRSELNIDLEQQLGCPARWVVVGDQDEVVDPDQSWAFFQARSQQHCWQRVIRCQWLGHQIDRASFREMQRWAGLG